MEDLYVSRLTTYVRFFFYLWTAMQRPGRIIHISRRSLFQFNNARERGRPMSALVFQSTWEISANGPSTQRIFSISLPLFFPNTFSFVRGYNRFRESFYRNRLDSWKGRHHILRGDGVWYDLTALGREKKIIPWRGSSSRGFDIPRIIRLELLSSVRHYLPHLEYPARYSIFSSAGFQDNPAQLQKRMDKMEKCVDETRRKTPKWHLTLTLNECLSFEKTKDTQA